MPSKKTSRPSPQKVESITVRLNPRMKYGLELLARKQHRSISSLVEWAIGEALTHEEGGLWRNEEKGFNADPKDRKQLLEEVWDPHASDRLIKLAVFQPELLEYEEELLWKFLKKEESLWENSFDCITHSAKDSFELNHSSNGLKEELWGYVERNFNFESFRKHWPAYLQFKRNQITEDELRSIINAKDLPSD